MDIDLLLLADELAHDFPQIAVYGGLGTNITHVQQWKGEAILWESDCLYCTCLTKLPADIPPDLCFLHCMDEKPANPSHNFILVPNGTSLQEIVLHIQALLLRLLSWQTSLLQLSMDSEDIQRFATISAPIFQNPIAIHSLLQNEFFHYPPASAEHWQKIQQAYLGNDLPPKWLTPKKLNALNILEGPNYYQRSNPAGRLLIDNVVCEGIRIATITITEGTRKLSYCHECYLQMLRRCLKRVFSRLLQKPEGGLSGSLIQLLRGHSVPDSLLVSLCEVQGWHPHKGSYRICVIVPRGNTSRAFVRNQLFFRDLVAGIYSKSVVFPLDNTIVLVRDFSVNHYDEEGPDSMSSLQRLLDNIDACMGSSAPFSDLRTIAVFYEQAKSVAFSSNSKSHTLHSHEYQNYLVYDIISSFAENREIEFYLHPKIAAIAAYDEQHKTELLSALYYYLLNDRSYKLCADKLHLHRNTFVYRVEKAMSILNCDISCEHVRLSILLSICMYWCLHPDHDAIGISTWRAQLHQPLNNV